MHQLFSTVENLQSIHVFIKLTFVWLLIQYCWVCQYVVEPNACKICTRLMRLNGFEILIAIDQSIHVDNYTVPNKVSGVASAGHTYQAAGLSVCFKEWCDIHIG